MDKLNYYGDADEDDSDRDSLPDSSRKRRNKSTQNKGKKRAKNNEDEELLVFGYEAHLFRDDDVAASIETDRLQKWKNRGDLMDRFDVRHLIDNERDLDGGDYIPLSPKARDEEALAEEERWTDLPVEEDEEGESDEGEGGREGNNIKSKYPAPQYIPPPPLEEPIQPPPPPPPPDGTIVKLKVPAKQGMLPPPTQQLADIIEKTAKIVHDSGKPQLEIVIKTRQAGRPEFGFMESGHYLFPYYTHVKNMMKLGLAGYTSDDEDEEEEEETNEDDKAVNESKEEANVDGQEQQRDTTPAATEYVDLEAHQQSQVEDAIIMDVLEKTANAVARNPELESLLKQKNAGDSRFAFLLPWSSLNPIYAARVKQLREWYASM
ncbi:hypothetical protein SmJEL517_g02397 [Synchytrium microbalum]|uniref:SURP motif domain-containing protein n=1 Tax=Synchytrium microbalum TaxID=1806994 RepID=A0A507C1Q2_9FUNG|nr:uncharacterized protein SmJEL517_g02397 [Synchytrium microbalum]TPX35047.1 hypothetical protein SmJEL517_g02397 [Synchytrium microbalum]